MTMLVNKFFHKINGSINTSLEPLNEIYFGKNQTIKGRNFTMTGGGVSDLEEAVQRFLSKLYQTKGNSDKLKKECKDIETQICKIFGFSKVTLLIQEMNSPMSTSIVGVPIFTLKLHRTEKAYNTMVRMINTLKDHRTNLQNNVKNIKSKEEYDEYLQTTQDLDILESRAMNWLNKLARKTKNVTNDDRRVVDKFSLNNGTEIQGDPSNLVQDYIIIDSNGIRFNTKKIAVEATIGINLKELPPSIDKQALTAFFLHEIGHNFTSFILSPNKKTRTGLRSKTEEMFADQFAAMYGYGYDLIRGLVSLYFNSYTNSTFDAVKSYENAEELYSANVNKFAKNINTLEHPQYYSRIEKIIEQMIEDLNAPYTDSNRKTQLLMDIQKSRKLLVDMNKGILSDDIKTILYNPIDIKQENLAKLTQFGGLMANYERENSQEYQDALLDLKSKNARIIMKRAASGR